MTNNNYKDFKLSIWLFIIGITIMIVELNLSDKSMIGVFPMFASVPVFFYQIIKREKLDQLTFMDFLNGIGSLIKAIGSMIGTLIAIAIFVTLAIVIPPLWIIVILLIGILFK